MNEQQIQASLARHAATPEISVHEYVDSLVESLGESIADRHKIYLDTRYWIYLRDYIRFLVSTGRAICPVSDVAWMELLKQTDLKTLLATATLLDELSLGVAIKSEQERIISEIKRFITPQETIVPAWKLENRMWVKAGYVFGVALPSVKEWSSEHNLLMQKTSVDLFWNITYREMTETSGALPPMPDRMEQSAAKITAEMRHYAHQIRSTQQAFAAEIAGALSVFGDAIGEIMVRRFYQTSGNRGHLSKDQIDETAKKTLNMLANAFRLRPKIMAQHIPTIYSYAMCHAAVRMDKSRKFNGHDLLDIHHASTASRTMMLCLPRTHYAFW
jgi:hypothetical protein